MHRNGQSNNHSSRLGLGISCLTFGAALGACAAALYTPHSGKRMRRLLWRKCEDAQELALDTSRNIAEQGRELYERGARFAGHGDR